MRVFKLFSVAVLITTVSVGALHAKTLRNAGVPAEFPPSSYKGKQYVDSKGCVFIRAGISGNVTWVPRVTRSRQQICGQKPTFAKAPTPDVPVVADATPPVTKPAAKPAPVQVATPKPAPKPIPKPVMRTPVAKPAPAPKRVLRAPVTKPAPAPKRVVHTPVAKPAPAPKRVVRRVVQKPVVAAPKPVAVPKPTQRRVILIVQPRKPLAGYAKVWTDGRLNPNRARGTAAGKVQMEMVWTNTVPSRLIAISTSQDTRRRVVIRVPRNETRQVTVVSTKTFPTTPHHIRHDTDGGDR